MGTIPEILVLKVVIEYSAKEVNAVTMQIELENKQIGDFGAKIAECTFFLIVTQYSQQYH